MGHGNNVRTCLVFASALLLTLATGCGTTAGGGGGGGGVSSATVGGKAGDACNKIGHDMGCYFGPGLTTGPGTVVRCNVDSQFWEEVQVCGAGFKCKETPKAGGPVYIKTATCEVDNAPPVDAGGQDAGSTDGVMGDAVGAADGDPVGAQDATSGDAESPTDAGSSQDIGWPPVDSTEPPQDSSNPPFDTTDPPFDTGSPPQDAAADIGPGQIGCKGKCNSSSVDPSGGQCWCDNACHDNDDCCDDKLLYCPKDPGPDVTADISMPDTSVDAGNPDVSTDGGSSDGSAVDGGTKPGTCKDRPCAFDGAQTCQCDNACNEYSDCCVDKNQYCPAS